MNSSFDALPIFKQVAERVDRRAFPHVTRQSVITELGIDSLSMMQIVGEMETELNVTLPDEDLVELTTVGDLCSKVEAKLAGAKLSA
jgi:acyl carrier protein